MNSVGANIKNIVSNVGIFIHMLLWIVISVNNVSYE
jgi:hypothetical protein